MKNIEIKININLILLKSFFILSFENLINSFSFEIELGFDGWLSSTKNPGMHKINTKEEENDKDIYKYDPYKYPYHFLLL